MEPRLDRPQCLPQVRHVLPEFPLLGSPLIPRCLEFQGKVNLQFLELLVDEVSISKGISNAEFSNLTLHTFPPFEDLYFFQPRVSV